VTWKTYAEDTNLLGSNGQNFNAAHSTAGVTLTSTGAPTSQYEVPLTSFSGTSSTYANPYNGSNQYNYAAKHVPQVFFTDTNGGNNPTSANPLAQNYAPLQQLSTDLANNTVERFNWITPDQYNDMHSALKTNFTYNGVTYAAGTDAQQIALGDNFLSKIVPLIEASQAFKNNGEIVIWNDETEGDETAGSTAGINGMEIIISPLAKGNAYTNIVQYSHSSDLRTLENIFGVAAPGGGYLGAANDTNTLSAICRRSPSGVPEPSTWTMMFVGFAGLGYAGYRRRKTFVATA